MGDIPLTQADRKLTFKREARPVQESRTQVAPHAIALRDPPEVTLAFDPFFSPTQPIFY